MKESARESPVVFVFVFVGSRERRAAAEGIFMAASVRAGRLEGDSKVFVSENVRINRARVIFVSVIMRRQCC